MYNQKLKKLKTKAEKPKLLQVIRHIRYAILNFESHIRDSNDPKNSYNPERRNYMYFQTFWTKGNNIYNELLINKRKYQKCSRSLR